MRFRGLKKWELTDDLDGLLFFAQRMEELLFDYSLDTYKPSALNSPFLCVEAIELIKEIENETIDSQNLPHVLEELKWAIQNDPVAKSLLDTDLDSYFLALEHHPLAQVKLRLEVLEKSISSFRYLDVCLNMLDNAIQEKSKNNIETFARNLVTTLINRGVDKTHLYNKTVSYFFLDNGKKITSTDGYVGFVDEIYPVHHEFEIYFVVSDLIKKVSDSIAVFDIEIVDELPEKYREVADTNNFKVGEKETYVEVKGIRTFDAFSAREQADRRLDTLKDLFALFNHKSQISWQDKTLINQCCIEEPVVISSPVNNMGKVYDMKPQKASRELNNLIKHMALEGGPTFDKFSRIVDLHGISIENSIPENQLLNIWISMETLVPTHVGSSKIETVINGLMPFLRVTYVRRLLVRFVSDMMLWDKYRAKKIFKKVPESKGQTLLEKALQLIVCSENEELRKELYTSLQDFHLLRYRAFKLHELLSTRQKVIRLINNHEKKVAWQIRRIYRTRNLIVHSGKSPSHINTLIENGHDYLDITMSEIIKMTCGDMNVENFDQAFELSKIRHKKMMETLQGLNDFSEQIPFILLNDY